MSWTDEDWCDAYAELETLARGTSARWKLLAKKYKRLLAESEARYRVLAAEVASEILTAQDREGVVKGLTRKL